MVTRVPTLDELMAMTPMRTRSESAEEAEAGVRSMGRELETRGLQPARRQSAESQALRQTPWPQASTAERRARKEPRTPVTARRAGEDIRGALGYLSGWNAISAGADFLSDRVLPPAVDFSQGLLGIEPSTPATPPAPSTQPMTVASPGGTTTGATAAPTTTAPARQTTFTNADAEAVGATNTIPALEVPEGPSEFESALLEAVQQLRPARRQATLIRSRPEPRMATSAFDRRLQLRERDQQLAADSLEQQGILAEEAQQGQRQQAAVQALAQLVGQERNLRAQLNSALVEAQANANTPEGQLAQAKAAQIQEALVRLRAQIAAGDMEPGEALPFLFGQNEQLIPVQGVTGTTGVYSNLRGFRPFAQSLLDPESE